MEMQDRQRETMGFILRCMLLCITLVNEPCIVHHVPERARTDAGDGFLGFARSFQVQS